MTRGLSSADRAFVEEQKLFFVATAAREGRVNLSPKGMDSLRVLDGGRIVWLNLSGSGNETAAHLLDNDRMTLMLCAFEGHAKIVRVYGRAEAVHPRDAAWEALAAHFPKMAGARQIFDLSIDLVLQSCGSGVSVMTIEKERGPDELLPFYEKMGEDGVKRYWAKKNARSIDGAETGIFGES